MAFHLLILSAGEGLQVNQLPENDEPPLKPVTLQSDVPEKTYY